MKRAPEIHAVEMVANTKKSANACGRRMKILFKVFALASVLALLSAIPLRAEEKASSITTALSSTTLSGYVDTSFTWNNGSGITDSNSIPAIYRRWLEQQQQQAIAKFNWQFQITHGFWGNPI